jgi:hypothetical protein
VHTFPTRISSRITKRPALVKARAGPDGVPQSGSKFKLTPISQCPLPLTRKASHASSPPRRYLLIELVWQLALHMFHRAIERIEVFFASLKVVTGPRRKTPARFLDRKARFAVAQIAGFFTSAADFPERWMGRLSTASRPVQGFCNKRRQHPFPFRGPASSLSNRARIVKLRSRRERALDIGTR